MPFFSIIIPVYNVAPYLRECLDSVLAQTFTNWEVICVDDGSTDGSGAILDEYAARDPRFRVIHQSNAGVSAARNAALGAAIGSWVSFLDADDKIDTRRLMALSVVIGGQGDVDWIHETVIAKNTSDVIPAFNCSCAATTDKALLDGWRMLNQNSLLVLNTYKRASVANARFPLGVKYAEDDIFELRCLPYCRKVAIVGFLGYQYRVNHPMAASRRMIEVENSIKIHQLLLEFVESLKNEIDNREDRTRLIELFTQSVRKDFSRVLHNFGRAPRCVRKEHRAISRQIYRSPFFSVKNAGPCRIGYWVYVKSGRILPMLIQDFLTRVLLKVLKGLKI